MTKKAKHKTHDSFIKRVWKKGFTLPGYNYLGPFNAEDNGPPTSRSDAVAAIHDDDYKAMGRRSYIYPSESDDRFIDETDDAKDYGGRIGNTVFRAKRKFGEYWGMEKLPLPKKRKEIKLPKGEQEAIDYVNNLKRKREDDPPQTPPRKFLRETNLIHPIVKVKTKPRLRVRVDPIPKKQVPPFGILTSTTQAEATSMPDGVGSGKSEGTKETPIDEVINVSRGPPNYTFASLPYMWQQNVGTSTQVHSQKTFRMTSPYDCSVGTTSQDHNPGAGVDETMEPLNDASDGTAQKARWFDFYGSIYNYYHVVSCRWWVTIENLATEPIWVHQFYHGETNPPTLASNQDILLWNDAKSYFLGPVAHAIVTARRESGEMKVNTDNNETAGENATPTNYESGNHVQPKGASNIVQFSGQYTPGDFNREIRLDSEVENWTLTNTNPALAERMSFRVKPVWEHIPGVSTAGSTSRPLRYTWTIKIEYLVEFKELKDGLRWPVQQQPLTITINNDPKAL